MPITLLGVTTLAVDGSGLVPMPKPPLVYGARVELVYVGVTIGSFPDTFIGSTAGSSTAVGFRTRTIASPDDEGDWMVSGTGYIAAYAFRGAASTLLDDGASVGDFSIEDTSVTAGPINVAEGGWLISAFTVTRGGLDTPINVIGGAVDTVRVTGTMEIPLSHGSGFIQDAGPLTAGSYSRSATASQSTIRRRGWIRSIAPGSFDPPGRQRQRNDGLTSSSVPRASQAMSTRQGSNRQRAYW